MPTLPKHLARLGKVASKYEFDLTVQSLRMKENVTPSKELVYVEVSRGSKHFRTNKAFVHTGDISWDDTFPVTTTLYKGTAREPGEPGIYDRKEYSVSFLEFSHLKHRAPRVICRGKLDLADFASEEGAERESSCTMLDRNGRPVAILRVVVKPRWLGDVRTRSGGGGGGARVPAGQGDTSGSGAHGEVEVEPEEFGAHGDRNGAGADDSGAESVESASTGAAPGGDSSHAASPRAKLELSPGAGGGSVAQPHCVPPTIANSLPSDDSAAGDSTRGGYEVPTGRKHLALTEVDLSCELAYLADQSAGHREARAAVDEVIDYAVRTLPVNSRFSAHGLPICALILARYASEVPSARFAQRLLAELDAAAHAARRDLPELAYRLSAVTALLVLVMGSRTTRTRSGLRSGLTAASAAATGPRQGQPPVTAREGRGPAREGAAATSPAPALQPAVPSAHERRLLSHLTAEVKRHVHGVLNLILRKVQADLAPRLAPAFLDLDGAQAHAPAPAPAGSSESHRDQTRRAEQAAVVAVVDALADALASAHVPEPLALHCIVRVVRFANAQLFNSLVQRPELWASSKGVQLKLALSALETAVGTAERRFARSLGTHSQEQQALTTSPALVPASPHAHPSHGGAPAARAAGGGATPGPAGEAPQGSLLRSPSVSSRAVDALSPVRQVADLLIVGPAALRADDSRREVCSALQPAQLQHILHMFTEDGWESPLPSATEMKDIVQRARRDSATPMGATPPVPSRNLARQVASPALVDVLLDPYRAPGLPMQDLIVAAQGWHHSGSLPVGPLVANKPGLRFLEHVDLAHFQCPPSSHMLAPPAGQAAPRGQHHRHAAFDSSYDTDFTDGPPTEDKSLTLSLSERGVLSLSDFGDEVDDSDE